MTHRVYAFVLVAALLALALPAAAQPAPNWPENNWRYNCAYTWPDGSSGTSVIEFQGLWATSHKFGDGNELKRGRLVTYLPSYNNPQTTLNDRVDLAYKPYELPSPLYKTRFELTLPDAGIQCTNFLNSYDSILTFDQCSNGIYQSCVVCFIPGAGFNQCP